MGQISDQSRVIPDDQIRMGHAPYWMDMVSEFTSFIMEDAEILSPAHSIGEISITGFSHIDDDKKGAGTRARAICQDLRDQNYANLRSRINASQIVSGNSFTPLIPESLKSKGPFFIEITSRQSELLFKIKSCDRRINETVEIVIPSRAFSRFGRTYLQCVEDAEKYDHEIPTREKFANGRDELHNNCSAFLAEKFAQQGCYMGIALAKLMFELCLYLATPSLMAKAKFNSGMSSTGVNSIRRPAGPAV